MQPVLIRKKRKNKASRNIVYLDRDGVLLEPVIRGENVSSARCPEEIKLYDDTIVFCEKLKIMGFTLVVVSNQPDLSRGLINLNFLNYTNKIITKSIDIDFFIYCPHQEIEQCSCRKPKTGMITYFRSNYCATPSREIMVGDRAVDFDCAKSAEIEFILKQQSYSFLGDGEKLLKIDLKFVNLTQALDRIKL